MKYCSSRAGSHLCEKNADKNQYAVICINLRFYAGLPFFYVYFLNPYQAAFFCDFSDYFLFTQKYNKFTNSGHKHNRTYRYTILARKNEFLAFLKNKTVLR